MNVRHQLRWQYSLIEWQTYKITSQAKMRINNGTKEKNVVASVQCTGASIKSHNFAVSRNENLEHFKFQLCFFSLSHIISFVGSFAILFAFVSHLLTNYCYHISHKTGYSEVFIERFVFIRKNCTIQFVFILHCVLIQSLRCIYHKPNFFFSKIHFNALNA